MTSEEKFVETFQINTAMTSDDYINIIWALGSYLVAANAPSRFKEEWFIGQVLIDLGYLPPELPEEDWRTT